jgi:glycine cleavage system transcriptional repressor
VTHFAVTAIGADRPGIVAALSEALLEVGGNLEDVSSTILRGHFASMLVVETDADASALGAALEGALGPLGVRVTVADVEAGAPERPSPTHVLSAYGTDRPGILARLSRVLADRGVNVAQLSCWLAADSDPPLYAVGAELEVPPGLVPDDLARELAEAAGDIGVDVTLTPIEVETL